MGRACLDSFRDLSWGYFSVLRILFYRGYLIKILFSKKKKKKDQPSISDLLSVVTNLLIEYGYIYKDKNQPLVAFICSCFYSINQIWSEAFKEDSVFNSAQILVKLNYNFDQYLLVMLNSCVLPLIKDLNRDFGLLNSTPGEDLITLSCPQGSRWITCPSALKQKISFFT